MEITEFSETRLRNEIEHGEKIAQVATDVWNWNGLAGKTRVKRRIEFISKPIEPEMKVLEIGCGVGLFTEEFAKKGSTLIAIDISPSLLECARENVRHPKVSFQQQNAYATSFPAESFDMVIGNSVLHHLDMAKAIEEIFRVLKPGGEIRFAEPNFMNPQIALQKTIPFLKKWAGDSPDETAFFRWPLKNKLIKVGFNNVEVTPFDFLHPALPAFTVSMAKPICHLLEKIPLLNEIAGSLKIQGKKN